MYTYIGVDGQMCVVYCMLHCMHSVYVELLPLSCLMYFNPDLDFSCFFKKNAGLFSIICRRSLILRMEIYSLFLLMHRYDIFFVYMEHHALDKCIILFWNHVLYGLRCSIVLFS